MKYLFTGLFLYLFYSSAYPQEIKSYVQENTITIDHIEPESDEFADLSAIGDAIGDAEIVMLGEQDHGDAPSFLAKTRLVKYLHEKKGFNVLAFESDFYGLTKGWDMLPKQQDAIYQFVGKNIFPLWSQSEECRYLFYEYIPKTFQTGTPLQLTGFDSQVYLKYSFDHLKDSLGHYLSTSGIAEELFTEAEYEKFLAAVQGLIAKPRVEGAFVDGMHETVQKGLLRIADKQKLTEKDPYWGMIIQSLIALNNSSNENRDKAMSANLSYLVTERYKHDKIIVWAANGHIMKYVDQLKLTKKLKGTLFYNMGTQFVQDPMLKAKTYILGFASYEGTAGRLGGSHFPIQAPNKNGLENWIPKDIEYGYIDFKTYNNSSNKPTDPFLMKSPSHFTIPSRILKVPWNQVYDGIFFIRNMYPTQKIK